MRDELPWCNNVRYTLPNKDIAMPEHPTSSWQAMQDGNVFYRKQQLYSIPGNLPNLGDYIIAGCRYGGPIGIAISISVCAVNHVSTALMRDSTKLIALGKAPMSTTKSQIQVVSSAGEGILSFSVDKSATWKSNSDWNSDDSGTKERSFGSDGRMMNGSS